MKHLDHKSPGATLRHLLLVCLLIGLAAGTFRLFYAPQLAQAKSSDLAAARARYPTIVGTALDSCALCHTSVPARNPYGADYKRHGRDFTAIELLDSDGDGFDNITEINAHTFPGDASSQPVGTATSTPTPTATASPTSPPGEGCTPAELIQDGGFEAGLPNPVWQTSSNVFSDVLDDTPDPAPHNGTWKAWMGGDNLVQESLWQAFSVPIDGGSLEVRYWWRVDTFETTHPFDTLAVQIRNADGTPLQTLETLTDGDAAGIWQESTYTLTGYAGQIVQLAFVAQTDDTNPTNFFLDDASVSQACVATSTPTPTLTSTAQPTFTVTPTATATSTPPASATPPATATSTPTPTVEAPSSIWYLPVIQRQGS